MLGELDLHRLRPLLPLEELEPLHERLGSSRRGSEEGCSRELMLLAWRDLLLVVVVEQLAPTSSQGPVASLLMLLLLLPPVLLSPLPLLGESRGEEGIAENPPFSVLHPFVSVFAATPAVVGDTSDCQQPHDDDDGHRDGQCPHP